VTPLPWPIEKLPQLTIARGDVWVTERLAPDWPIDAAPDVTTPWVGRTFWACEEPKVTANARDAKAARRVGQSGLLGNGIF
jgi:hypothetical protein